MAYAEWEFIQGLEYRAQTGDDADFVRMMYTVRLKKVRPSSRSSMATDVTQSSNTTTR